MALPAVAYDRGAQLNFEALDKGLNGGAWTALPFGSNWANFGGAFLTCAYLREPNGFIALRGLATNIAGYGFGAASAMIGTVPGPPGTAIFMPYAYDAGTATNGAARVDIASNGQIMLAGNVVNITTGGAGGTVSLNGIRFRTR